ncbi:MAG TPA: DMT family transporter [Steroidobacteraceae bacterium]|nr:DMT family transporter [Steroidobacteraceae bacterium]
MQHGRARAIALMLGAVASFSGMDTLLKILSAHYPPLEVAVLRGACSLPFMLVPLALSGAGWRSLRPRRLPMHVMRAALMVVALGGFIYAVRVLSLANAYAVFLSAPLLVTALSAPLLKEPAGAGNWVAILVGLVGVLTMLRPDVSGLASFGSLAALVSALAYALSVIAVRALARTESTPNVVLWTIGLMTLFAGVLAAPGWVPINGAHWPWLVALGLLAAVAQYLLTEAFRSAPPPVVAPFEYTALLWGIAIDWLLWHVLPSFRVCLGGSVVIASGLYVFWHERQQARNTTLRQSWKWTADKGRMLRRSSTVEDVARKQEEESP